MTKIYVWPDATYLDADEYGESEFIHKGADYFAIDLQAIVDGKDAVISRKYDEVVGHYRLSELLQAEHQLKALTTMFVNYRNTMREMTWEIPHLRETIKKLEADYQGALRRITELEQSTSSAEVQRLNKEMSDVIASKDQEIKTILAARDQWVKELQAKLREATSTSSSPSSEELLEENRRLKSQLAGATARIRKQIDGYDAQAKLAEWKGRAEAAEAKLEHNAAISSDIEDNLRKERDRYATLLAKHGVCTDCGDMYEHHEDEPLASCACGTTEWPEAPLAPYMLLQRALREARDAEHSQAQRADDAEQRAQDLRNEMDSMKHEITGVISRLQEIE
jgi:chromosome segregation ATPase